jgi:regulator of sigma E protease
MNALTGWALLSILFMFGAPVELTDDINEKYISDRSIVIAEVIENSPASEAGLEIGDIIIGVAGNTVANIDEFQQFVASKENEDTRLTYKRDKEQTTVTLAPRILKDIEPDRAIIGIAPTELGTVQYPIHKALVAGAQSGYNYSARILSVLADIVKDAWNRQPVAQSVGGPIAIAVITSDVLDMGFAQLIIFIAVLSLNFAVINILPFPALDGGRLIFVIAEKLRGKPSRQIVEAWFHRVGFILLILLMIAVTYRDIARFGGRIWNAVIG